MQDVLIDIYKAALLCAWPLAIGAVLSMGVAYFISRQLHNDREQLRQLRVSLEKGPSPAQMGEGLRMWPEIGKFPQNLQIQEMVKRASIDENRRAERVEVVMGIVRFIGFLAFIGIALIVAGMFYRP